MKKKMMATGLSLFTAFALGLSGAALADDAMDYEADNLTIQVGADASELNFNWFTTDTAAPTLVVCKANELVDGACPSTADSYTVTMKEVVEEESGGSPGGPGGPGEPGGPGGSSQPQTTTATDSDDAEEDTTTYACKVTVEGLEADTRYAYSLAGNDAVSISTNTFSTKNTENYNFIFVGDPQIGASKDVDSDTAGWAETVTAALEKFEDTSFILSSGDQVESSTSDSQYDGFFSAQELTSIPLAPANGNHDKSVLYSYHFNVPNESDYGKLESTSEAGDTLTYGGDYWFTYGSVLFMVINSNNSSAAAHSQFLAEAIETNSDAVWKVVVFHHSLYSSASHITDVSDLRTSLVPVMDEYGIDVVLAGHDHFYARSYPLTNFEVSDDNGNVDEDGRVVEPDGTVYFTADSASGSKYYDFNEIEGYTNYYLAAYSQPKEPSYLNVEVKKLSYGDSFTVSAYLTADGEQIDTYTILKKNYDLNGDGVINRNDIKVIKSLLRQPASVNPAADVDNDGTITSRDARKLFLIIRAS